MKRIPILLLALTAAHAADDAARANAYDDAWQASRVAHCRSVAGASGKTAGLVLEVGDSITHANPYGQWPRWGAGKTADDAAIIAWCHGDGAFSAAHMVEVLAGERDTASREGYRGLRVTADMAWAARPLVAADEPRRGTPVHTFHPRARGPSARSPRPRSRAVPPLHASRRARSTWHPARGRA